MMALKRKYFIFGFAVIFLCIVIYGITVLISRINIANKPIYVVVKSTDPDFDFWQVVKLGVETAAAEIDVEVYFTGPMDEIDIDGQLSILDQVIERRPRAIVLAAADYKKLTPAAECIINSGITLVAVDSGVDTPLPKSLIATNNIEAARRAGEEMLRLLDGKGKVAVMVHVKGVATAIEREEGFRQALNNQPGIELLEKTWYSEADVEEAYIQAMDIIEKNEDIAGIFGANQQTVIGIAKAVKEKGLAGKVKVVGFDGNYEEVQYIEEGVVQAVMVQKPFNMGYMSVMEAYAVSGGKKKHENIDTGAVMIRKDNLYTPENQKLLFPFVER